jgi:hypothetical protein
MVVQPLGPVLKLNLIKNMSCRFQEIPSTATLEQNLSNGAARIGLLKRFLNGLSIEALKQLHENTQIGLFRAVSSGRLLSYRRSESTAEQDPIRNSSSLIVRNDYFFKVKARPLQPRNSGFLPASRVLLIAVVVRFQLLSGSGRLAKTKIPIEESIR